jgi:hypothetical protein
MGHAAVCAAATLARVCVQQEYFHGFRFVANVAGLPLVPALYNTQQTMIFFDMLTERGAWALNALREAKARVPADGHFRPYELMDLFGTGMDVNTQVRPGHTMDCWCLLSPRHSRCTVALQVSTRMYDTLRTSSEARDILNSLLDQGKITTPRVFATVSHGLSFMQLNMLPTLSERDAGRARAIVLAYLFSAGCVRWVAVPVGLVGALSCPTDC